MPLDIDNGLPIIHMRFGTSGTNKSTFCTHVDSCAGMDVVNLKLQLWIITTNPENLGSYIQFDAVNPFYPICLNYFRDKEINI